MTDTRESVQKKSRLGRLFAGRWLFLITILVGIGSYVIGLNVGYLDIAGAILAEPYRAVDGAVTAKGPGIGLEWDESAIARFAAGRS